jgi:hypothetical protein
VSDCSLTPNDQSSAISCGEQVTFWWDDDGGVNFVLDQHHELDFYSASSLKQQSTVGHDLSHCDNIYFIYITSIGGVMVSVLASSSVDLGSTPGRVLPKIIKLVFVASPGSMQY